MRDRTTIAGRQPSLFRLRRLMCGRSLTFRDAGKRIGLRPRIENDWSAAPETKSACRKVGDLPHIGRHSRNENGFIDGASWRTTNAKTTLELLADLQHEFWIYGHPVWVGVTACQH